MAFAFPPEVIDMTLTGTVLAVDEPKLLAYTWGAEEVLRFELCPEGVGTRLVLTDQLQAGWAARNAAGWEDCLDRLAGLSVEPGAWQRRFDAYRAAFEPEIGAQEGPARRLQGRRELTLTRDPGAGAQLPQLPRRHQACHREGASSTSGHDHESISAV